MQKQQKTDFQKIYANIMRREKNPGDLSKLSVLEIEYLIDVIAKGDLYEYPKLFSTEYKKRITACKDPLALEMMKYEREECIKQVILLLEKMNFMEKLSYLTKEGFVNYLYKQVLGGPGLKHIQDFWDSSLYLTKGVRELSLATSADGYHAKIPTKDIVEPLVLLGHSDLSIKLEVVDATDPEEYDGDMWLVECYTTPYIMFTSRDAKVTSFNDVILVDGAEVGLNNFKELAEYKRGHYFNESQFRPSIGIGYFAVSDANPKYLGSFENLNVNERNLCAFPEMTGDTANMDYAYYPNLSISYLFDELRAQDRRNKTKDKKE